MQGVRRMGASLHLHLLLRLVVRLVLVEATPDQRRHRLYDLLGRRRVTVGAAPHREHTVHATLPHTRRAAAAAHTTAATTAAATTDAATSTDTASTKTAGEAARDAAHAAAVVADAAAVLAAAAYPHRHAQHMHVHAAARRPALSPSPALAGGRGLVLEGGGRQGGDGVEPPLGTAAVAIAVSVSVAVAVEGGAVDGVA